VGNEPQFRFINGAQMPLISRGYDSRKFEMVHP
jgi:hypothetical protein